MDDPFDRRLGSGDGLVHIVTRGNISANDVKSYVEAIGPRIFMKKF
jgi:hypothetical protein